MSQAKDLDSTNPTRRALLSTAPTIAAAALGVGTIANTIAIAKADQIDPVFSAIERYKAAVEARAAVLNAEQDEEKYPSGQDWTKASHEAGDAELEAFYNMLEMMPTTIAGVAALLEVLGTDPYNEGSFTAAGWAYNNQSGCDDECPVDQLMRAMAELLRGQA